MHRFEFPDLPGQDGLATTSQLRDVGVGDDSLRSLALGGRRVMRTVYARHGGPLSAETRLVAASLWAGPRAVLTGARALQAHGLTLRDAVPVTRFLVPETRRTRRNIHGVLTVRTRRLPVGRPLAGVLVAPPERALADAGRFGELTDAELRTLTLAVLQRRLTTVERVAEEFDAGGASGLCGLREGAFAFREGAWSPPETLLIEGVRAHPELPAMLANPRLLTRAGVLVGVPDGYFPDAGVVVQVHSRQHHDGVSAAGVDRWAETLEKDLRYQRHGLVVVPVAPRTLQRDLAGFLSDLARIVLPRLGHEVAGLHVA